MKDTRKKILLVGDGNHQFILNYVIWLRKRSGDQFQIDILSLTHVSKNNAKTFGKVYEIQGLNSFFDFVIKLKGIRKYFRPYMYKKLQSKLPAYDFVHFHFIGPDSYLLIDEFKKSTKSKIILSIWGSDLYRIKEYNEKRFMYSCKNADIITFTNPTSENYFKNKYDWNRKNLSICRFGLAPLENLKKLPLSKVDCKKQLNWSSNKIAITIGYNLSPAQQHLEILNQFQDGQLDNLKDKIQIILPLTYGGNLKYKKKIIEKLNELPFEFHIYDSFLEEETIAEIRKATDIMIQLQKTDQFSGSMQEHLFAKNIVITGSWLPYETMKEYGVWFSEVDKISDINMLITDVIGNYSKYEMKTHSTPQAILNLSSWDKNIEDWIKLYGS